MLNLLFGACLLLIALYSFIYYCPTIHPFSFESQSDVDSSRLLYFHDGSPAPSDDDFYFSVTDGAHQPVHRHFLIAVMPLQLALVNSTPVEVEQVREIMHLTGGFAFKSEEKSVLSCW